MALGPPKGVGQQLHACACTLPQARRRIPQTTSARLRCLTARLQTCGPCSDIATISANACAFNGEDSEIAEDAAALAAYLTAVLQGQVRLAGLSGLVG